jgi:hypothetical protein
MDYSYNNKLQSEKKNKNGNSYSLSTPYSQPTTSTSYNYGRNNNQENNKNKTITEQYIPYYSQPASSTSTSTSTSTSNYNNTSQYDNKIIGTNEDEDREEIENQVASYVNRNLVNKDKAHFFIGNILRDQHQTKILKIVKKKIVKQYQLKEYHSNYPFCTNLVYMGYLDQNTAHRYMENIMSKLLIAISEKIGELVCKYSRYTVLYDKSFYKIGLEYNDENNYLSNIIMPYLKNEGIMPIFNKTNNISKPIINLFYYKSSNGEELKKGITVFIPRETFVINNLSLIKGTPSRVRSGTPSLHDHMNFEEFQNFKYDLKKSF